jgi:translocation and assembly module TamB
MNLQIRNQIPIRYKTDNIDIEFTNDITIIKDYYREFKVLGTTVIESGYYKKDDKKFLLDRSYIYFSGNPKKPNLELKAIYNKEQYHIQIFISGSTDDPIINFNSDPYLTQKQILSLILFDSTGENSGSGTELYSLLGGTFAKELMKSLGISVDHLVLGKGIDEQLSVEVGQKISKDITVIYLHNNGKDGIKVRVDHSQHFETDILIYPQSSSIEFLYKSD